MRIIDQGTTLEHDLPVDPPGQRAQIRYIDHKEGLESMLARFPGLTAEELPGGLAWAVEGLLLSTHSGTHMDAPWHFHPTANKGEPAKTIDQLPLEWCISDGVMVDFSHFPPERLVTAKDFEETFDKIGYKLKPFDIVYVQSGAAKYWGTEEYQQQGCGIGREATLWLLDQGVKIVGTDAWSWDRPLDITAKIYEQTRDSSIIWEGHFAGIEKEYFQIEKLTNLDKLPPFGFKTICIPTKIKGASAGWVRPVAIIED